jgi:transketolase
MSQAILIPKMRRCFADILHQQMARNKDIWVITADLGYKMWDTIREDYPERFLNAGASEQAMMGIAVGLALEGKIPIVYSITPFLLYRSFETIRNYVNHERIPVKLIGSGRGRDYVNDGFSHWAEEDRDILKILSNIESRWPEDAVQLPTMIEEMLSRPVPFYLNLRK